MGSGGFSFFSLFKEKFFSKRTKRHFFFSFQKGSEPKKILFSQPPAPPYLRRVPTPSKPPADIGGGLIDCGSIRRLRQVSGMAHKLSPFG
jgi:hypothetical protein